MTDRVTLGVARVAGGGSLLRARLCIEEEEVTFGGGHWYTGMMSWHVDIDGGLPLPLMGQAVPVAFLTQGNYFVLRGEAWIKNIDRDVIDRVGEPLRFVWSSVLAGSGPLTLTSGRRVRRGHPDEHGG